MKTLKFYNGNEIPTIGMGSFKVSCANFILIISVIIQLITDCLISRANLVK